MTNPVSQFRNGIFGSRGCNIQEAIDYANELINTLPQSDQVGIRVGLGVLLNTIDNAVTQSQGPSPEKLAIIALIDERIAEHKLVREEDLQSKVMDLLEHDNVDDQISDWMSNNFDIDDYNVDYSIERWIENNLDEKVSEAVNNLEFSVTLK
jgi:hypothetical protein